MATNQMGPVQTPCIFGLCFDSRANLYDLVTLHLPKRHSLSQRVCKISSEGARIDWTSFEFVTKRRRKICGTQVASSSKCT